MGDLYFIISLCLSVCKKKIIKKKIKIIFFCFRYRMDGSLRQLWSFRPFSRREHSSNRADYHWSVVQSSPWTFRPFNRRLIVPHCQWSSGPSYHLSAEPCLYCTNSRFWHNDIVEQSVGKWTIGLSLCLSTGLLLYWTKTRLFHQTMVPAIP